MIDRGTDLRRLAAGLLLALAALAAAAQSQGDMNRSAAESLAKANAALASALGAYRERLGAEQRGLFDRSQEGWENYRDTACRFEASGTQGGSAHSMVRAQCQARQAAERLKYLERLSHCEEGDLSCPAFAPRTQAPGPADVFGYYFLMGPQPSWAEEIDMIHLATVIERGGRLVRVPLWGLVRMNEMQRPDYRIPAARLENGRVTGEMAARFRYEPGD